MRNVIECYVGIWILLVLFMVAIAFTSVNMHVIQARKIFNDLRAEVQASNGSFLNDSNYYYYDSKDGKFYRQQGATDAGESTGNKLITISTDGYEFEYSVIRLSAEEQAKASADNTYMYNNLYKISLRYVYTVPLFGTQVYPMTGYAY